MSAPDPAALLAARVASGDEAASHELVEAMRPLVSAMARRFAGRVPRSDLEQAGMVGVLHAAQGFDAAQGTPFGGYAAPFVMGEMLSCVRQLGSAVRVPRSLADAQRTVNQAIEQLTAGSGRSPTVPELAQHTGLDPDLVLEALRARLAANTVALDDLSVEPAVLADDALMGVEQRLDLGAKLDQLDPRSREAVLLRFGLELSQREIATRLGISQMHVSRLLRAAMATLAQDREEDGALRK
ncbi:MAG: polymerase sigma-B factor [Gaiellales bacterium]|nr:polymerase sigma-B factor [Gaiellales bacterium]